MAYWGKFNVILIYVKCLKSKKFNICQIKRRMKMCFNKSVNPYFDKNENGKKSRKLVCTLN